MEGAMMPQTPTAAAPRRAIPIGKPPFRRLRVYAFDPSLSGRLDSYGINEINLKIPWEVDQKTGDDLPRPGPVGEYVEVVDYDPASGCFYEPVDLNNKYLLAQDGLGCSEGNPQFHQQMVYAVSMLTIRNFERALGRRVLWAPRIWKEGTQYKEEYVPRLRIYPHALREANAYYSPQKKALLFGYFPAGTADVRDHLPGGMVFTCLSHDIVAHETTHALLDGLHRRFNEQSNSDVLAFHEAFADIVALFQHFSFPDVLRHQIAKTRGDLGSENLLGQLAQEFGKAIGNHGALRDTLGGFDEETGHWTLRPPDPARLSETEPHARGSLLVSAVFNAFVSIYRSRAVDLLRIATNGTGVLPEGSLHPDLVDRLAQEAAKSARHIVLMCIRALDYCPPVDLTFGDYLRALITADYDLVRDDDRGYRIAVVEAFRRYGIYPRDVRSLSVDSLLWSAPAADDFQPIFVEFLKKIRSEIRRWNLRSEREEIYHRLRQLRAHLHERIRESFKNGDVREASLLLKGFRQDDSKFEVHSLRPCRRVGPDGDLLTDLVIEVTQWRPGYFDRDRQAKVDGGDAGPHPEPDFIFRGGATLIVDFETTEVRYYIYKDINNEQRLERQRSFLLGETDTSLRALYFGSLSQIGLEEPFALLHRSQE
jgi:hypothetical protein